MDEDSGDEGNGELICLKSDESDEKSCLKRRPLAVYLCWPGQYHAGQ